MILGDGGNGGTGPTLDELFRRAGVRHPHAIALADPPDRARFTDGASRALTFSQADRAISAFAAKLRGLGLHADTVVGLQLPNTVESVIALLGVLRAGMIAAPLPLLWRKRDIVDTLERTGAKVFVTASRMGEQAYLDVAMQVAAELFPIRYVCAFGASGADGIVPLDDIFDAEFAAFTEPAHRERLGAHIAVLTFETGLEGIGVAARGHAQLIACGSGLAAECGFAPDAKLLTTVPLASFAGLTTVLVPWLLGGGTLHFHQGFAPESFTSQCATLDGGAVVLPGAILPMVAGSLASAGTVVALWRAPERMNAAPALRNGIVDVACFGEIGIVATPRDADGNILPLPWTHEMMRTTRGTFAMQASGVHAEAFPPPERKEADEQPMSDFIDTGCPCQVDYERGTATITGGIAGMSQIGGYRFARGAMDALIAHADPDAIIVTVPDALLGERLAASAANPVHVEQELEAYGANSLIASAFRPSRRSAA